MSETDPLDLHVDICVDVSVRAEFFRNASLHRVAFCKQFDQITSFFALFYLSYLHYKFIAVRIPILAYSFIFIILLTL